MDKWENIERELAQLKEQNLFRSMTVFDSPQSRSILTAGKEMLLFSSNSYLDLCNDREIKEQAAAVMEEYGTGSGGSRLTTGTTRLHQLLEEEIAEFKGREAALVFNTGYMANVGILSSLAQKGDMIYSDELNHASIIDGCRLSRAETVVYRHNDMRDLEEKIKAHPHRRGLIVSDGVFSMDGDIVNLPELVRIADKYQLLSMIDEAHATGVIGATGRGTEEYYGMEGAVDVLMGTLSKSVGSEGGFVCGSEKLISYLLNKARSFIFSTSLSPSVMAASLFALRKIRREPKLVESLQENIRYCCSQLQKRGLAAASETAIIPLMIGDEGKAMQVMERLKERGFYISAIRYPTVARGKARLRITLMSSHRKEDIDSLVENLEACINDISAQTAAVPE